MNAYYYYTSSLKTPRWDRYAKTGGLRNALIHYGFQNMQTLCNLFEEKLLNLKVNICNMQYHLCNITIKNKSGTRKPERSKYDYGAR